MTTCEASTLPAKFTRLLDDCEMMLSKDNYEMMTVQDEPPIVLRPRVSHLDILHGTTGDCRDCPIARALLRAATARGAFTAGLCVVQVYEGHAFMAREDPRTGRVEVFMAKTTPAQVRFVSAFDNGESVSPMTATMQFRKVRIRKMQNWCEA